MTTAIKIITIVVFIVAVIFICCSGRGPDASA
jgi:hypothetical protein